MTTPTPSRGTSPERIEIIQRCEQAKATTIVPGVILRPLIDARAGALNLFTGLLVVEPGAKYPYYTRTFTEALTILEGEAAIDAEDRRYRLGVLDNATFPERVPRRVVNLSATEAALIHVSLASCEPDQVWVNARFAPVEQPVTSKGRDQHEWISRNDSSARYELASRAVFQDLFGAELGSSGICGGYGLFEPGARLPCHRHEFDESITIIQGTATCIVEGRRHELSHNATALVPQGRCHYFINLTLDPMVMIWVYAGDRPDPIIMGESCCHPEKAKFSSPERCGRR
jgi:quercetin dioxygenase-like cupin family protein